MATSIPWGTVALVGVAAVAVVAIARLEPADDERSPVIRRQISAQRKKAALADRRSKRQELDEQRKDALADSALSKARIKATREQLRADRLAEQASRARTMSRATALTAKAETATKTVEKIEDIAARIDNGGYTPGELRELMSSGQLRLSG